MRAIYGAGTMRFSLLSLFMLTSAAAIVAFIFTLNVKIGCYVFLLFATTLGSIIGSNRLVKRIVLGSVACTIAAWILICGNAVAAGFPSYDSYVYFLFLKAALASAGFGAVVAIWIHYWLKIYRSVGSKNSTEQKAL